MEKLERLSEPTPSERSVAHSNNQLTGQPTEQSGAKRTGFIYVVLAVLLFGTSAVLVAAADPVSAIEKTFDRLLIATLFILSLLKFTATGRHTPTGLRWQDTPRLALYGLVAAFHFGLYIAALNFTTAAHALTIVYTSPVWVTLGSALFLKEPIKARQWLGVMVVGLGVAILAGFETQFTSQMLLGDGMALGAALAFAVYSLAGRQARHRYSLWGYTFAVYGFATLWLLVPALISFFSGPGWSNYSWGTVLALLALGLGPLGTGHTLYNAALRRIHATYANVIATQEVTVGVALAWLFLGQALGFTSLVGVVVALAGTILVLL